eukprot:g23168.t1
MSQAHQDYKTFYMKQKYRQDTYQVMKHMKISASLDKGTPNMERWNTRIKKEMNDWLAIYRRQNVSVGRQSYYSLYSAINTLASHFTSYGPKFPFPNKRRPRFFELCQQAQVIVRQRLTSGGDALFSSTGAILEYIKPACLC